MIGQTEEVADDQISKSNQEGSSNPAYAPPEGLRLLADRDQ